MLGQLDARQQRIMEAGTIGGDQVHRAGSTADIERNRMLDDLDRRGIEAFMLAQMLLLTLNSKILETNL